MNIPEQIFKSYDIRGIYPEQLNQRYIVPITKAIHNFFLLQQLPKKTLKIAVGRDMRLSTPVLFKAVAETLIKLGTHVIDLGILSTPTFYFAVFKHKYAGGIQITASHNPKEYNGLKIVRYSEKGLIKIGRTTGMDKIKEMSIKGVSTSYNNGGTLTKHTGILKKEVKHALKMVGNPILKSFVIVADPANALGGLYIEELFNFIPGKLIRMNFELDGTFPAHQADPLQTETLKDLQKKVVTEHADLGLAPDGDGDRLFFIDDKGQIVPPSIITALVAKELLKKYPGEKILADIRYILTPKKVIEECKGVFEMTKVGHAFITEKLHETNAIFAGESSAHYFFRETGNAESQLPIILFVLKVLTRENKTLSQIVAQLQRSHESGEINFKVKNAQVVMDILKNKYTDGGHSSLDGIAISYPLWRFSARSSNTEPLLRLNIEGNNPEIVLQKKAEIITLIQKYSNLS